MAMSSGVTAPAEISVPVSICRAVARDFKERGITQVGAAKLLKIEPKSVANQISGNRPFSKKSAKLYADTFGYSEPYLLTGEGSLLRATGLAPKISVGEDGHVTVSLEQYKALEQRVAILEKFVTMLDVTSPMRLDSIRGPLSTPKRKNKNI